MHAASLPLIAASRKSPAEERSTMQAGSTSNGRTLKPALPASPRISCHSTWWAALTQGGFKGLHQWMVRSRQDRSLSVADRLARPAAAVTALRSALKADADTDPRKQQVVDSLMASLKDAAWYKVDVEKVMQSVFSEMTTGKLEDLKDACKDTSSLCWIADCVDERLKALKNVRDGLLSRFFQSVRNSGNGSDFASNKQTKLWNAMEASFNSVRYCNLKEEVARVIKERRIESLLNLALNHVDGLGPDLEVLKEFSKQAFEALVAKSTIKWDALSDAELDIFSTLLKQPQLAHWTDKCNAEIEKRAHCRECKRVEAYIRDWLNNLVKCKKPETERKLLEIAGNPAARISESEIRKIFEKVIAKLSPEDVITVSKMTSASEKEECLIGMAKMQLQVPKVELLDNANLIAYLGCSEKNISSGARKSLVEEAKKRAEEAAKIGNKVLIDEMITDSYRTLVRAVLEFSMYAKLSATLQKAAGIKLPKAELKMTDKFLKLDSEIQTHRKLGLQRLAHRLERLEKNADAAHAGKYLQSFIRQIGGIERFGSLASRHDKEMREAIADYFPNDSGIISRPVLKKLDADAQEKYFNIFATWVTHEDSTRKFVSDGEEFPVCTQFVKDTREPTRWVGNKPVHGFSLSNPNGDDLRQTKEFLKMMRGLEGVTEDQIMTASVIASQNTSNSMSRLFSSEQLASLTEDEVRAGGADASNISGFGLFPAKTSYEANAVMKKNGNLTMHVRIFNAKVAIWAGEDPEKATIGTDPEASSFLMEVEFEIDKFGKVLEKIPLRMQMERKITSYSLNDAI
nr:hypothetical protein [uncultured Noviherbaspirillum sp.]